MGKREGDHAERNEEPEQGCTQMSHGEEETRGQAELSQEP